MLQLTGRGFIFDDRSGHKDPVEALTRLLCAEMSMISTYKECTVEFKQEQLISLANECLALHKTNATQLRTRITELGGKLPQIVDPWRMARTLINDIAGWVNEKLLLQALSNNELSVLEEYEGELSSFGTDNLELVQGHLIRAQQRAHELVQAACATTG